MEFIHLFNLAALLVVMYIKLFKAWTQHDNINLKRKKVNLNIDADLYYYDGGQIKKCFK